MDYTSFKFYKLHITLWFATSQHFWHPCACHTKVSIITPLNGQDKLKYWI